MPLPLPPYSVAPADTAGSYLKGAAIGAEIGRANAQIAMEQQRLQAQMAQAAMEAQIRQQQIEQNARIEQQRIEIANEYHKAQISMQQDRLEEAKRMHAANAMARQQALALQEAGIGIQAGRLDETRRMNEFKAEREAGRMQAMGQMRARVQELVDQGVPEGEANLRASSEFGGAMGAPGGSLMATSRYMAEKERQAERAKVTDAFRERTTAVSEEKLKIAKAQVPMIIRAIDSELNRKYKVYNKQTTKRAIEQGDPKYVALEKEIQELEAQKKALAGLGFTPPNVVGKYNPETGDYVPVTTDEESDEEEF